MKKTSLGQYAVLPCTWLLRSSRVESTTAKPTCIALGLSFGSCGTVRQRLKTQLSVGRSPCSSKMLNEDFDPLTSMEQPSHAANGKRSWNHAGK